MVGDENSYSTGENLTIVAGGGGGVMGGGGVIHKPKSNRLQLKPSHGEKT